MVLRLGDTLPRVYTSQDKTKIDAKREKGKSECRQNRSNTLQHLPQRPGISSLHSSPNSNSSVPGPEWIGNIHIYCHSSRNLLGCSRSTIGRSLFKKGCLSQNMKLCKGEKTINSAVFVKRQSTWRNLANVDWRVAVTYYIWKPYNEKWPWKSLKSGQSDIWKGAGSHLDNMLWSCSFIFSIRRYYTS